VVKVAFFNATDNVGIEIVERHARKLEVYKEINPHACMFSRRAI